MKRLSVAASVLWIVVTGWLLSRDETWLAIWQVYCHLFAAMTCTSATVFVMVHWHVIAIVLFGPVVLGWLIGGFFVALRRGISRSGL